MAGENGARVPSTPYGLVYGRPLTCVMQVPSGVGFPTMLLTRQGASVCSDEFHELDPWTVKPSNRRATSCSSTPFTRYVGPLTTKVVLPRCTGSNSGSCTFFQSIW